MEREVSFQHDDTDIFLLKRLICEHSVIILMRPIKCFVIFEYTWQSK